MFHDIGVLLKYAWFAWYVPQTCVCSPRVIRGELFLQLILGFDRISVDFTSMAGLPGHCAKYKHEWYVSERNLQDVMRRVLTYTQYLVLVPLTLNIFGC